MSLNRNCKKQRWTVLKFFRTEEHLLLHRLSRKRFRHWQRNYHRANARRVAGLSDINIL
jgi:hypothetical protein